jgi:hypothetical protein
MSELAKQWRQRRWLRWTVYSLAVLSVLAGLAVFAALHAEPYLRARIVEALQQRFHARVELDGFHVSLREGLEAEGQGLRIWPPAQAAGIAVPAGTGQPMIALARFRFRAPLMLRPARPIHISVVHLEGLSVDLPPKAHFAHLSPPAAGPLPSWLRFAVDRIECAAGQLTLETSKPGKLPQQYQIASLTLTSLAAGGPMRFEAQLRIPLPRGLVLTQGTFGPWLATDPGESPVAGDYRLQKADLGVFHGIAGTLDSTGHFQGTLRDLAVQGQTHTPDFRLTHFNQPLRLETRFRAQVDGTNGDTQLQPVEATLGGSHFTASGSIVRVPVPAVGDRPRTSGHQIDLQVVVDRARIDDFLRLTSKTGSVPLSGDLTLKSTLQILPGPAPIHQRLKLNGSFTLDAMQFTAAPAQRRLAELSLRGQGRPDALQATDPKTIRAALEGRFTLVQGLLGLPNLDFSVPGASVELKGGYGLESGALNFTGSARLAAPVSKIVGGWKGALLSPLNGLFRRQGAGAQIPIRIEGTRESPKFNLDWGKLM